jgi:hypothetical protein
MASESQRNESVLEWAGGVVAGMARALMKDGTIAAAMRQGADELGAALKAFPDSIQTYEMGTLWSPTPYEISKSRSQDEVTPSTIAKDDTGFSPDPIGLDGGKKL